MYLCGRIYNMILSTEEQYVSISVLMANIYETGTPINIWKNLQI
jgi:hypothetical protein